MNTKRTTLLGVGLLSLLALQAEPPPNSRLREPVHPRRNVDEFQPVMARYVRFTILKTNSGEPCLDELEIHSADDRNLALSSAGATATVSGSLPGYKIHRPEHLNDGYYGNAWSWISDVHGRGWVIIEFPMPVLIGKVVWGRDREGQFIDRLATEYRIEVALQPGQWREVASSADRKPLPAGAVFSGRNPATRHLVSQFAPITTSLPAEPVSRPAEYALDVWQTEHGLRGNTVNCILQTRDGYLWLGTFNGLVRFDGVRFVVFDESDGLVNSRVACLFEDRRGTLWIGTEGGGVARYDHGRFVTLTEHEGLADDIVLSIAEDSRGRLWIGTWTGLTCREGDRLTPYASPNGEPVYQVLPEPGGRVWVLAGTALRLFDGERFTEPEFQDEPSSFSSLLTIAPGRDALWIGGANSYVAKLSPEKTEVFGGSQLLFPNNIWSIHETRNRDVWIGTASGGLARLRQGEFTTFTTEHGLPSNAIRAVYEDREGNLWIGSNDGGLIRLKPKKLRTFTTRDGLSHNVVMSMVEDGQGQVWIGSNGGGLNRRQGDAIGPTSLSYLLDNECVWSLCAGKDNRLWIGTWGGGLFCRDGDRLDHYQTADGLSDSVVLALLEDRTGGLWIGTYGGGLNYLRDGEFTCFNTTNGLSADFITCLLEDRAGHLWIGTGGGGLNRLADGRFTQFTRSQGLGSDFIRTLVADEDGTLWIGTSEGLSRLRDGKIATVTTRQGLEGDLISQILDDHNGRLWCGSNQGIFSIAKDELHAVLDGRLPAVNPVAYGKGEGMESLECTGGFHPAGLRTRDGQLWFSTVKGLVVVDPANLTFNHQPPPIVIEELLAEDRAVVPGPALKLPPRTDHLEIRYTALSLVAPEKVRFKHKLEGLDRDWVDAGTRRVAYYTRLPPGDYQFRVSACNNDGVWNEAGAVLAFAIQPTFYQTWWFALLAIFSVIGAGGWTVRAISVRRLQRKLDRLERQHALEKERARIARDIHDDLGASLTQIGLVSELGQSRHRDPNEVQTHFRAISRASREAVQAMDAIVWAVNPRNDSLDHLASYISEFAQDFFRSSPIRCRLDVPTDLPEYRLSSETRHNVFLTVREALTNVARHSQASEVWVRLSASKDRLIIVLEDNGVGFALSSQTKLGNGLVNMRRRTEEMGGTLDLRTAPKEGTRLEIRVPLYP